MGAKKKKDQALDIEVVGNENAIFPLLGLTPFVCNAMSQKVIRELTLPSKKVRGKAREMRLKHDMLREYRDSPYLERGDDCPTRITFPASAFKKAMGSAAKEIPGVTGAAVNRLCWAEGFNVSLWGVPQMWSAVVRSADAAKTPDVRTRAILPQWAAVVRISYVSPNLNHLSVANLLASAGVMIGVGDGRPEKGALNFGQFKIVNEDDEEWQRIIDTGGREAQDAALESPEFYDTETADLYEWFQAEAARRGFEMIA